MRKVIGYWLLVIGLLVTLLITNNESLITPVFAVVDPLSVPNNRFGIHIITPSSNEASAAAQLVNTRGDWGYITVLIESNNRDQVKWQNFFNELRRRHLIPLVRLATQTEKDYWKRPYPSEEMAWADFLNKLNWPTKNRYVIIYNEPNHATEWGNSVDPKDYAQTLNKTIDALKAKSPDFFVLNSGLDASAPSKVPLYEDQLKFMQQMKEEIPEIFQKLDGWVSHSYPHPGYVGFPNGSGRGTVRTYLWELEILRQFGVTKNLPVFIAETGWKHAEGLNFDPSLPNADTVAGYYKQAFETAWDNPQVAAVTPFLLNYQELPFDHFSFKKITGEGQKQRILGAQFPEFYPHYLSLMDMPKTAGLPAQENKAELVKGEIYQTLVAGQTYLIPLTFKNLGQSIWNDRDQAKLVAVSEGPQLPIDPAKLPVGQKIEPGQNYTFQLKLKAPQTGSLKVVLSLYQGGVPFDSAPVEFTTEVKSAVTLKVKANLKWKNNHFGQYLLSVIGPAGTNTRRVTVDSDGQSIEFEAPYLLPDYTFEFTLDRPFYQSKKITQKVHSGVNTLDFGELHPDIPSALLNPYQLWKLLPFS